MEVHLVHKSADGALAVVGVMVEEGNENLALSEFWSLMPRQAGETKQDKRTLINARDLLPHDTGYYRYMGSLTTPPCSEGVHWHVMAEPVTASAEQIRQIASVIGANARPVQPTGQRLVLAPVAGH
jgi:carbonic anhydrase